MKTTKPKLIASTNTLEKLLDMVNKYFYSTSYQLGSDGEVFSTVKGRMNQFQWRYKAGRFRFERIEY